MNNSSGTSRTGMIKIKERTDSIYARKRFKITRTKREIF